MKIRGLVSLITGGCSGMGLSTAQHLVSQGGKVIVLDINEKAGAKCQQDLGSDNARFIACDVSDQTQVKKAYEQANSIFGGVRNYVHSAGIIHFEKIIPDEGDGIHSMQNFKKVINTNLYGSFLCTSFAAWHMKNLSVQGSQRGLIINTSSIFAEHAGGGFGAYGASKGGIEGMLLPIARELGRYQIRVVNIAPGIFLTPMNEIFPPEAVEATAKLAIRGKLGKPEYYAQLVEALVTNEYINGTSILMHDGMVFPNM